MSTALMNMLDRILKKTYIYIVFKYILNLQPLQHLHQHKALVLELAP